MHEFPVTLTTNPTPKPQDESKLGFGQHFTDHMFVMDYSKEKGWHDGKIVPFAPIEMSPAAMVLHYSQTLFEGLKAYRNPSDEMLLFRAVDNMRRLNSSARRLCMPEVDEQLALDALVQLLRIEREWLPKTAGTSIYVRPLMFATDPFLGVRASYTYKFIIMLGPVGAYYPNGLAPVGIYVEDEYVRAVAGGIGSAKTGGNYAASILAGELAKKKGYTQVMWLDGIEHKYVDEIGTSNAFFKFKDELVTPPLGGAILPGITRDSVIRIARSRGITVNERRISIAEVFEAYDEGRLEEVFATGTAAVVSPAGQLCWNDRVITINDNKIGSLAQALYDTLTDIQYGRCADPYGWTTKV